MDSDLRPVDRAYILTIKIHMLEFYDREVWIKLIQGSLNTDATILIPMWIDHPPLFGGYSTLFESNYNLTDFNQLVQS